MFEHTYPPQPATAKAAQPFSPLSAPAPGPTDQADTNVTPTPTCVLVVDDHTVVRNGIAFSLLAFTDLEVVAQASTGEEALRWCAQMEVPPDVVLMDLMMPGMGGVAAIRALRADFPQVQV